MKAEKRILGFLQRNRKKLSPLLILTHDYPDPDALASAAALAHLAGKKFGIRTRIAYGGVIGRTENREMVRLLKLPVSKVREDDFGKYKSVALVDTQPAFHNNSFPKNRRAAIVIDQHGSHGTPKADFAAIDTAAGATSALVARTLMQARIPIPSRLATALVYGILSDTMSLYRVTDNAIIDTYLHLIPLCDLRRLALIQNPPRSRKFFSAMVEGIRESTVRSTFLVSHIGKVDNPDLVAQIADLLLTCEGIKWALCTGRYEGTLHMSLRAAHPAANAGGVLRDVFRDRARAGGHGRIAGGKYPVGEEASESRWEEAEHRLARLVARRLRIPLTRQDRSPFGVF